MAMESTKTINGTYGKCYHDGEWLTNVFGIELQIDISYEDVKRSGTRKIGKKAATIDQSGTLKSYKVTRAFEKAIGQIMDDRSGAFVTELVVQLDDPENTEVAEFIRIKGVQFTNIPVLSSEHGSLVEDELNFVFEDFEYINN